ERNLRLIAAAWLSNKPALLEGPTSAGKTSAIRYLAWKTESPYRRINLSYYTEVEDLIGRYEPGEKKYDEAGLQKRSEVELRRIGEDYGLKDVSDDQLIKRILEEQEKPHWVD